MAVKDGRIAFVGTEGEVPTVSPGFHLNARNLQICMIAAYTINGAYCNHQEQNVGSIETGKFADFIILDKNLFDISPFAIHETRVLETFWEVVRYSGR